ncbi:uncharacterized protein LOC134793928 [Cydia splendana]|uniref:uncharacterized protein LOC134793928 n=1 Tax=Cydia splendana TaxID=1100963 RepID=UPI00300DB314
MPLMRIRSVEIVFEDEMSTCTDTGLLDRSIELIVSDSSDDSTKCVDDLEHLLEREGNDSVTLNAEGDFSEDNSVSLKPVSPDIPKADSPQSNVQDQDTQALSESVTFPIEDVSLSLLVSEMGDSGRFTEDPSSSHYPASQETVPVSSCEDALLSQSLDVINVDTSTIPSTLEISDISSIIDDSRGKLFEYIDSSSSSSDSTAVCDGDARLPPLQFAPSDDDTTVCDSSDLQYDSFVDLGKF